MFGLLWLSLTIDIILIYLNNVRDSGVLVQGTPCTPEREKLS